MTDIDIDLIAKGMRDAFKDDSSIMKGNQAQMIIQNFSIEADLFLGREGIEHAADRVHFAGNGFGGTALGAFEDHVLHKMSEAVLLGGFAAGAIANPYPDGDGADVVHGLGDHNETVGQNMPLDVAMFGNHSYATQEQPLYRL